MILHDVRVHPSKDNLPREDQLAWKIAAVAADKVAVTRDVTDMIINRIIDNAAVAIASVNRHPIISARDAALGHPRKGGAAVKSNNPFVWHMYPLEDSMAGDERWTDLTFRLGLIARLAGRPIEIA